MSILQTHWTRLSISEVSTQCKFALLAWSNLDVKALEDHDTAFSSAHSFLSHAANISKLLRTNDIETSGRTGSIGIELLVSDDSIIHDRRLRNNLEHYEERLKGWIRAKGVHANIGLYNLGPKSAIGIPNFVHVTNYDSQKKIFTFVDEDFDLAQIACEIIEIQSIANSWLSKNRIVGPFSI